MSVPGSAQRNAEPMLYGRGEQLAAVDRLVLAATLVAPDLAISLTRE